MKLLHGLMIFVIVAAMPILEDSNEIQTYKVKIDGTYTTCKKCPAGTRLVANCTENGGESKCEPCEEGFFQSSYTRATRCAKCDKCDSTTQTEEKKCTNMSNTQCRCKEGFQLKKIGGNMNIEVCIKDTSGTTSSKDTSGATISKGRILFLVISFLVATF